MKTQQAAVLIAVMVLSAAVAWGQSCPCGNEVKLWGGLDSKPRTNENYQPDKVVIGIGSYEILELRGGAAGYTLAEREVAVYNRLLEVLSKGPACPGAVCVCNVRSAPTIFVGGVRVVSVYASDAAAAGTTQADLAEKWRQSLATVLPKVATAQVAPRPAASRVYDVAVGGLFLFRLRDADGYASLKARGVAVEERVVQMLSDGRKDRLNATAQQSGGAWSVNYGEIRLVTVTAADAMYAGTTSDLLARKWAADLNAALAKLKEPTGDAVVQ